MAAGAQTENKSARFKVFEESLSDAQRRLLLRNPDILHPELISQLYQASLERLPARVTEPPWFESDHAVEDFGELTKKRSRKMVNSWMTFRSYYSPLIKDLPQKIRSPMLALLWKNDVDHGLWELLSAAFSYIRDKHAEDGVTIDQFLVIASQVVPVVPADQYFTRCGWVRVGDILERSKNVQQELPKVTNFSCAGVVRYCFRQGLISRPPVLEPADARTLKDVQRCASSISFASAGSLSSSSLGRDVLGQECRQEVQVDANEGSPELAIMFLDNYGKKRGLDSTALEQISLLAGRSADERAQVNDNIVSLLSKRREIEVVATNTECCASLRTGNETSPDSIMDLFLQDDIYLD